MIYVTINFNYNTRVYSIIDNKWEHIYCTLDTFDISSCECPLRVSLFDRKQFKTAAIMTQKENRKKIGRK